MKIQFKWKDDEVTGKYKIIIDYRIGDESWKMEVTQIESDTRVSDLLSLIERAFDRINENVGSTANRMPLEATEKPVQRFKSNMGITLA